MAKSKKDTEKEFGLDQILFKCRDHLRAARNSGSFFEKRDMMLTLVFLRFLGEKYEDGLESLREKLISEGLDPEDENIRSAFFDDATFTDGTYNLPVEARWSVIINTPATSLNVALDTALSRIEDEISALKGCFVKGTFTARNLALRGISHNLGEAADSSFTNDLHKGLYFDYIMANPPFNLKSWYDDNLKSDARWADYATPPESNANYAWILHILSHLKHSNGVAGFLLANGALNDSDTYEIRKKLIQNDKVEAIIVLPRESFITTDISVTLWILNNNKKGGKYQTRKLRDRSKEILFMDLRSWSGDEWHNGVKNMQKKKFALSPEQICKASEIYHKWQEEGTDGENYEQPELYKSVGFEAIKANNFSLVPSRYIEFVDRDANIDYDATLKETSKAVSELLKAHESNTAKIKAAFEGLGYECK